MLKLMKKTKITSAVLLMAATFCTNATVVEIRTNVGVIEVNLFDETTPQTVANFLRYVNSGEYENNVVHRMIPDFVIQGGGFKYTGPITSDGGFTLDSVATGDAVTNEPRLSNLRGTIAMAKGSDPDSARSQWFINLEDNNGNITCLDTSIIPDVTCLDSSVGGYTVFGQVIGDGMQVADAIADSIIIQFASPFSDVPIRDYTQTDSDNDVAITDENLIVISDIVVTDPTVVTNPDLNPVVNTLINTAIDAPIDGGGGTPDNSSGGGAFGWLGILAFIGLTRRLQLKS